MCASNKFNSKTNNQFTKYNNFTETKPNVLIFSVKLQQHQQQKQKQKQQQCLYLTWISYLTKNLQFLIWSVKSNMPQYWQTKADTHMDNHMDSPRKLSFQCTLRTSSSRCGVSTACPPCWCVACLGLPTGARTQELGQWLEVEVGRQDLHCVGLELRLILDVL